MATAPSSTMMMEITMATIGPVDEESRHGLLPLRRGRRLGAAAAGGRRWRVFGVTTAPSRTFCIALDDHAVAGLEAVLDHPEAAHARADRHVAERHLVVGCRRRRRCRGSAAPAPRAAGRAARPSSISSTNCARPYWPGRTRPPGLGNLNWIVSVPVVGVDRALDHVEPPVMRMHGAVGQHEVDRAPPRRRAPSSVPRRGGTAAGTRPR